LKFNKDIRNEDGTAPDNLTDAINDVDNKVMFIDKRLTKLENAITLGMSGEGELELDDKDIENLKKFIDSLF
jgi:hypothetical protein